ncbi:site-2 protease family protein [Paenisporosarcina indica]|uniref:site-2 protease family protein n=1 Tax=Paenisporosarcina indica TaxID=650093 RepID=UPI001FE7C7C1|nr:site-2 protease family protein [Paenisporosarcina indica]
MHAWMASLFGDDTAKNQGRVTLNPLKHLDVVGTLLIFIAGIGWAKPVPVNSFYFSTRRLQSIIVSLVGPLSNFVLAFIGFTVWYFMPMSTSLEAFLNIFVILNVVLGAFNLLPLPPLDGYRIVSSLLPAKIQRKLIPLEVYGSLLFLIVVLTPIGEYTIVPYIRTSLDVVMSVFSAVFG